MQKNEKWILCGASSGLGQAFAELIEEQNYNHELFMFSRKSKFVADFSNEQSWLEVLQEFKKIQPDRIFYFAGGGPYGQYSKKSWESHLWSYRVNFLFPAFLLSQKFTDNLKQFVLIGSKIAENKPDPMAASYSASKFALRGLFLNLIEEKSLAYDLRLFSPGYMDTRLLPGNAWPRQSGLVQDPKQVAKTLSNWISDESQKNAHFIMS